MRKLPKPTLESDMQAFIETIAGGLMLGALYALFGLGLSLSLGVMKMINIAHGDLIVLGAYLCSTAMQALSVGPFLSLLAVVPMMFVIGYVLQRVLLNRVVGRGALSPLLLTFGLSIVVQNVLQEVYTADTRSLQAGEFALQGFDLGGVSIGLLPLASHLGRQARAVADDPGTARLVGVNDRNFFALVTGFVLAVIALASVMYGIRTPFSPTAGPERLLYSFEAVVLGGLGNVWGTFVGGLIIGVAQLLGAKVSSGLGPFFGHLVFLIALLARPQGLFGKGSR
jgi:branched-chain amino acid transport system permease protein